MEDKSFFWGLLLLGLIIVLTPTVSAVYTTYNNSVTFSFDFSNTTYTTYNNSVTSVFELNDNIDTSYYCYQESANTSNQSGTDGNCSLSYTGAYKYTPSRWFFEGNTSINGNILVDGYWVYAAGINGSANNESFYINYSKPSTALNSSTLWDISYYNETVGNYLNTNFTIPTICFTQNANTLMLMINASTSGVHGFLSVNCYNGTDWYMLYNNTDDNYNDYIKEEGIYWNVSGLNPVITDSCTYTSGNWNIKCGDACNITTATSLGSNNITLNGTGTVFVGANISGWKRVDVWTGCTVIVNRSGGGFV